MLDADNSHNEVFDREFPECTEIGDAIPVASAQAIGEYLGEILCSK